METFVFTIIGGIVIFISGQFILRFIIEPAHEFKKTLAGISYLILYNQAKLTNAHTDEEVANEFSVKSAEVISKSSSILCYRSIQRIFGLPPKANIIEASQQLNWLSHGMKESSKQFENGPSYNAKKTDFALENSKALIKIGELLKLKTTYNEN